MAAGVRVRRLVGRKARGRAAVPQAGGCRWTHSALSGVDAEGETGVSASRTNRAGSRTAPVAVLSYSAERTGAIHRITGVAEVHRHRPVWTSRGDSAISLQQLLAGYLSEARCEARDGADVPRAGRT